MIIVKQLLIIHCSTLMLMFLSVLIQSASSGSWWRLTQRFLTGSETRDCRMLRPEDDIYITLLPSKPPGPVWERRQKDCESQKLWVASKKQCFLHTTGRCTYEFTAVVTVCSRPEQAQTRQNSIMGRGSGHEVLLGPAE